MNRQQVALYARVSSTQQADAGTIVSQLSALRTRIAADGLTLSPEMEFIDDGYSGSSFLRPGLERIRDVLHAGGIDRLYVLAPDRLARQYAYQVVLLEEFQAGGLDVVFLNRSSGQSAEDELLVQVQGMLAEYERAKILERTRRGKRHAASQGAVSVLSGAPYGYRYVCKQEGAGQARYEIVAEEAQVVRPVFEWVGSERATIEEVCRRLEHAGARTRTGKTVWNRSTMGEMLNNPAYTGGAPFGRTRLGEPRPRWRPLRGHTGRPKRPCSILPVPAEQWILIPVPAIVSSELFAAVHEQLAENRQRVRERRDGNRYMLQGLIVCGQCGYGCHGRTAWAKTERQKKYFYYRCNSGNGARRTGLPICRNAVVRGECLDQAVWAEVCTLLQNPSRLADEYQRRLENSHAGVCAGVLVQWQTQHQKVNRGITRLIDSYAEGLIEKSEFEPRIQRFQKRASELAQQVEALTEEQVLRSELQQMIGRLEEFALQVKDGLETAESLTRRDIIRAVVRRIEVEAGQVKIVFKVSASPFVLRPGRGVLPHCPGRFHPEMSTHFGIGGLQLPAPDKPLHHLLGCYA
jgi:site-specific DNA recombinase